MNKYGQAGYLFLEPPPDTLETHGFPTLAPAQGVLPSLIALLKRFRSLTAFLHGELPFPDTLPIWEVRFCLFGATSQIRTGDLHFTKVLLYQLS